jgi:hypothetical protein
MKRILGWTLAVCGWLIFAVAIIGHFSSLGDYPSVAAREWERFDRSLVSECRSWAALQREAQRRVVFMNAHGGAEEVMLALFGLVTERFTHHAARHTFLSNWLLATFGAVHPGFAHIRSPEIMVQRGHSLLCDQSSYLLLRLALENGIWARHVGLDGHVVMEAWYDDDWHMYDPDLEIMPRTLGGDVLSVEELARTPDLLLKYYGNFASMVDIVGSRKNNTYMSYPAAAWFEWKSNALYWFEKLAECLKFVLPLLVGCVGVLLLFHSAPISRRGE